MASRLSAEMGARPVRSVCWTLNHVGVWLLRVLPARLGVWILYRVFGWLPLMRYRLKVDRVESGWQIVTVRDLIESEITD